MNRRTGSNDVTIRHAVPQDLDGIGRLWVEFMDFHKERDAHFTRSADGHQRFMEFIAEKLASDKSCVLVAEQSGVLVGYCLAVLAQMPPVFEHRDYGSVFDLAVTERHRRSGLGRKMYEAVEAWFKERGVRCIEVRVVVVNEVSTAFWKKMGFKPSVMTVGKTLSLT